jgi:hypothetical protein
MFLDTFIYKMLFSSALLFAATLALPSSTSSDNTCEWSRKDKCTLDCLKYETCEFTFVDYKQRFFIVDRSRSGSVKVSKDYCPKATCIPECSSKQGWNGSECVKVKCDSDEKWNGNYCEEVDCGKYSTYDSKKDKCVEIECDKGEEYDYKKDKCVEIECSKGYTLDYKKGKCVKVECPAFKCADPCASCDVNATCKITENFNDDGCKTCPTGKCKSVKEVKEDKVKEEKVKEEKVKEEKVKEEKVKEEKVKEEKVKKEKVKEDKVKEEKVKEEKVKEEKVKEEKVKEEKVKKD